MDVHKQNECPHTEVKCTGCVQKVRRREMNSLQKECHFLANISQFTSPSTPSLVVCTVGLQLDPLFPVHDLYSAYVCVPFSAIWASWVSLQPFPRHDLQ